MFLYLCIYITSELMKNTAGLSEGHHSLVAFCFVEELQEEEEVDHLGVKIMAT